MALNIFKKEEAKKEKKITEKKEVVKKETVKKQNKTLVTPTWNVLISPCITEKAVNMSAQGNFYTFEVEKNANKLQIKKAIEAKYSVNVLQVRVINIPAKKITRGRIQGMRSGYKKAIVKVKEGQKIEVVSQ
jgi:large subunit ribosomal protein L23